MDANFSPLGDGLLVIHLLTTESLTALLHSFLSCRVLSLLRAPAVAMWTPLLTSTQLPRATTSMATLAARPTTTTATVATATGAGPLVKTGAQTMLTADASDPMKIKKIDPKPKNFQYL